MINTPRLRRIINRLLSRSIDYSSLRSISSCNGTLAWAKKNKCDFFNSNVLRAKIVHGIIDKYSCNSFIETGTYHAGTTIGVRQFLNIPVYSCDNDPKNYYISRAVTFGMTMIYLYNINSTAFLNKMKDKVRKYKLTPFIYLDAHEGDINKDSLPLRDEVKIICKYYDSFICMVDDFCIPNVVNCKSGNYGGVEINIDLVRDILLSNDIEYIYFPSNDYTNDTGYQSGFCFFGMINNNNLIINERFFPFNLISRYSLKNNL